MMVNGESRESIIDHVYFTDAATIRIKPFKEVNNELRASKYLSETLKNHKSGSSQPIWMI